MRNISKILSVSEFIKSLNEVLGSQRVIVQGETSKLSFYPYGVYFNLKDKEKQAVLPCFIWSDRVNYLGFELKEGMEIQVEGFPRIYEAKGSFHFQVERINLVGEGALKQAFEALKKKLDKEGLFNVENKKSVPRFCQTIGLITSQYGKGAKPDFLKHLGNFGFQIYFYDVRVEGIYATEEIVNAIRWFNENLPKLDVLVITRGGGSWESLQAFNSESVARAIFASKIPIISGVGHESDVTIADLVADIRASTPTHAAKILSDPWKMAKTELREFYIAMNSNLNKVIKEKKQALVFYKKNIEMNFNRILKVKRDKLKIFNLQLSAGSKIQLIKQSLGQKLINLNNDFDRYLKIIYNSIEAQKRKLEMANPELKLRQGYSLTFNLNSRKLIKSAQEIQEGDKLETKFYKGVSISRVIKNKI